MAPRGRPKKSASRMDAAIDAMTPLGYPKEDVGATVKNLLKECGGNDGYPFIEANGYKVLIDAILTAEEERKQDEINHARGKTSVQHGSVEDDKT